MTAAAGTGRVRCLYDHHPRSMYLCAASRLFDELDHNVAPLAAVLVIALSKHGLCRMCMSEHHHGFCPDLQRKRSIGVTGVYLDFTMNTH